MKSALAADYLPIDPELRRPVKVQLPSGYKNNKQIPVVFLLHGYKVSGNFQDKLLGVSKFVNKKNFALVIPNGTKNEKGHSFWNADDWCCGSDNSEIDDVDYINRVIKNLKEKYGEVLNTQKIFLYGHSNGALMANRLACEIPEKIAGIVSLAGTIVRDSNNCKKPYGSIGYLHIHGIFDKLVHYNGNQEVRDRRGQRNTYPSVSQTLANWQLRNNCFGNMEFQQRLNMSFYLFGKDTDAYQDSTCEKPVIHWKINRGKHHLFGVHIPLIRKKVKSKILDTLLSF